MTLSSLRFTVPLAILALGGTARAVPIDLDPPPDAMGGPVDDPDLVDKDGNRGPDDAVFALRRGEGREVHRYTKADYPLEVIRRPMTLAEGQLQVGLDVPFVIGGPSLTQVLRGSYGIDQDLEIGLTYGFGLTVLSPTSYEAGKAFSLDGAYTVVPGILAAQLRLGFNAQPFALGVSAGAPFRFTIGGRWAVFGGHDLVQVRVVKFPVDAGDPAYNVGTIAWLDAGGSEPVANVNVNLGGLYQARPDVAVYMTFGTVYRHRFTKSAAHPIFVGATWARSQVFDLGARVGIGDASAAGDTFTFALYGAYRL
jgi:hypothetical protein